MRAEEGGRICVVGAGISGLAAAKILCEDGFDVTIVEKRSTLGGVWAASRTYPGLRANNSGDTYAFSDFPYPDSADDFPTAEQIRSYLESYADHFELRARMRLSTEVTSISRTHAAGAGDGHFEVRLRPALGSGEEECLPFDFVVVCNGVFSEPRMPEVKERERFAGEVLHSSEFTEAECVSGKRVVVVGAGKSALDCARWAAQHGSSSTLVFRSAHWMLPRYLFGRIRVDKVLLTRFSELFLAYHHKTRLEAALHGPLRFLVRLFWRMQHRLLRAQVGMPAEMTPQPPLPAGIENAGVGGEAYEEVRRGTLVPIQGQVSRFSGPSTLELETGERLDADIVVFATGWRQETPFLAPELRDPIERDDGFRLYRHILATDEQRLGFIGYASSFECQLTAEIAAHWLSQVFRGELELPSPAAIDEEISRVLRWTSETVPAFGKGFFIGPYQAHYIDDLVRDMGMKTSRTGNPLTEFFGLFSPARYRDLGAERRRARSERSTAASEN